MSEDKKIINDNEELNEEVTTEDLTNENIVENNEEVIECTEVQNEETEKANSTKPKRKIPIKSIIAVVVAGGVCLGVGFMQGKNLGRTLPATTRTYNANKVIATVGDTKITGEQLRQRMEPLFYINGKTKMTKEEVDAYESSFIDYMTTTEVLYLEGKAQGLKVEKDEVDKEYSNLISSLKQSYNITEDDLINKCKIPKDTIEKELEKELIAVKYIGQAANVTDEEAKKYYDENKSNYFQVRASHILIKNMDDEGNAVSDEQKKKNKEQAEDILKQAKQGADFAQLAKKYSQDTSAENGGDLDFFGKGQMVEPFEKAAFSIKVGEIYPEVVESDYGYHIIKKTGEKQQDFDSVKDDIVYNLGYEKQKKVIDDLTKKYNVQVKK